ncbi:MAG TPA: hypothetical protein VNX01_06135, partial [Bacteroidia bacterium]|nr:hypothetical protein [Bacteroidia bacterium]
MSIFSAILHFFEDLFSAMHRAWDKLPANIQSGLLNGSGILNIINQWTGQDPALTIATIQANYPNEDLTAIYNGLAQIAKVWGLNVPATLPDLVVVIQDYLKKAEATMWPAIISGAAGILAQFLAGSATPFEIISTLLQWVYTTFVKPTPPILASLTAAPAQPAA